MNKKETPQKLPETATQASPNAAPNQPEESHSLSHAATVPSVESKSSEQPLTHNTQQEQSKAPKQARNAKPQAKSVPKQRVKPKGPTIVNTLSRPIQVMRNNFMRSHRLQPGDNTPESYPDDLLSSGHFKDLITGPNPILMLKDTK